VAEENVRTSTLPDRSGSVAGERSAARRSPSGPGTAPRFSTTERTAAAMAAP
jgi:hypothetical protein